MFGGFSIEITEREYKGMEGKEGLLFFPSCNTTINTSSIAIIRPKDLKIDDKGQTTGRLHDGTRVKKLFGHWVDAEMVDHDGKPIKLDPHYYPEVVRDEVMTEDEWNNQTKQLYAGEEKKGLPTNS